MTKLAESIKKESTSNGHSLKRAIQSNNSLDIHHMLLGNLYQSEPMPITIRKSVLLNLQSVVSHKLRKERQTTAVTILG